eukprot:2613424-Prymnesium_polylepis.1
MLAAAAVVLSATPAHSAYDRTAMIDAYLSQFGNANLPLLNIPGPAAAGAILPTGAPGWWEDPPRG